MACDIMKVIEVAKSQIGYLEKKTWDQQDEFTANAGDKNYVKYSRDLAKYSFYNSSKKGVAWCDIFVDWCFMTAYGVNAAYRLLCQPKKSCGAGCAYSAKYYKSKGRWHDSNPQPGDQIFFWPKDQIGGTSMQHTGLVVAVDSTYVYTVEGNTSSDPGVVWNGGSVNDKKYKLSYNRIAGYGRPDYANVNPDDDLDDEQAQQTKPDTREEVEAMYIGTAIVSPKTGEDVNFRRSPSKSAGRVSGCLTIPGGKIVNIKSTDGTWAAIEYNGYQGYMMTEFLVMTMFDGSVLENEPEQPIPNTKTVDQIVAEIMALVNQLSAMAK